MTSPCHLCGGRSQKKLTVNSGPWSSIAKDYDIARCKSCGFEFVDPIPGDDELRAQYDGGEFFDYGVFQRGFEVDKRDPSKTLPGAVIRTVDDKLDFAESHLGRKGTLLDVGCGEGQLVWVADWRGWQANGMDTSKHAVEFAATELDLDVRRGILEEKPFAGEKFDVVTLLHTFEHLPRPLEALECLRELVATGGLLLIEVPNLNSLARYYARDEWRHYVPARHLFYFSKKTLGSALEQTGFRPVGSYSRSFNPRWWKRGGSFSEVPIAPAAQTGGDDRATVKERTKQAIRWPLEQLVLLDSLLVWATPA